MCGMSNSRRRVALVVLLLLLLLLLLLWFGRCSRAPAARPAPSAPETVATPGEKAPAPPRQPPTEPAAEVLTPAKLTAADRITAGAVLPVQWEGPKNQEDFITIVAPDAPAAAYANYKMVSEGNPLQLTGPIDAGKYEIRYIAGRSKTILGRAPLEVTAAEVTLTAVDQAPAGTEVSVSWVGPNNPGDYLAVAVKGAPDRATSNYVYTRDGSPSKLRLPPEPGDVELRYVSGQGDHVLARRPIRVEAPAVTLNAPPRATAGALVSIEWSGPSSSGDYITIVPRDLPDGRYGNNSTVSGGSPTKVLAPIEPGACEIRFMSGQGARVFARRPIEIVAAEVTLSAPESVVAGAEVSIAWTGPKNSGDYITIVPKTLPDGRYGHYATVSSSPTVKVIAPLDAGEAEIRYMSGQGGRVLGRRALTLTPFHITLGAPAEAAAGSKVAITWTGPNNHGDYLTIVPADTKDGMYGKSEYTSRGSPLTVQAPDKAGSAEIRYMSGDGARVLARRPITLK